MKKKMCLVLALMLMTAAQAEVYLPDFSIPAQTVSGISGDWGDAFLTAWETARPAETDIYNHNTSDCYGLGERIMNPNADMPCPVCMSEENGDEITAVERGGTVIVRIPDAWMEKQTGFTQPFFGDGCREYTGEEAQKWLAQYLRGQTYADFLGEWNETGSAEAVAWTAGIAENEKLKEMNDRHLGNASFFVLRPMEKVTDTLNVNLSVYRYGFEAEGEILRQYRDADWNNKKHPIKLIKDDAAAAFTGEYNGCKLTLYETEMGVYAAVIYKYDADDADLFYLWLRIDNRENIVMNGYMYKNRGVYCCVLTKGEAQMIMDGKEVVIENAPQF